MNNLPKKQIVAFKLKKAKVFTKEEVAKIILLLVLYLVIVATLCAGNAGTGDIGYWEKYTGCPGTCGKSPGYEENT